jgi:hypothetical protein
LRPSSAPAPDRGTEDHWCTNVVGHEVEIVVRSVQQHFVHLQSLGHRFRRDATDGEAHVIEDVVADGHRLIDDVETDFFAHAPEIDDRICTVELDDTAWNT